jgi:hypothetical protein
MRPELRASAILAAVVLASCDGGGGGSHDGGSLPPSVVDCGAGTATLQGTFVAPNGTTAIAGGLVTASTAPGCTASTAQDGTFSLRQVPSGPAEVVAQRGIFKGRGTFTPGTPITLPVDPASVHISYVAGDYDHVEAAARRLGFNPTAVSAANLASVSHSSLDMLMLNCGLDESYSSNSATRSALQSFVQAGGVLYVSDYAYVYVNGAFPGRIQFLAAGADAPYLGGKSDVQATVVDPALTVALGRSSAAIRFDLESWVVMDSAAGDTKVLLRGPAKLLDGSTLADRPFAVQFGSGAGRVTYTSFHNEAQSTSDMEILLEQMLLAL